MTTPFEDLRAAYNRDPQGNPRRGRRHWLSTDPVHRDLEITVYAAAGLTLLTPVVSVALLFV